MPGIGPELPPHLQAPRNRVAEEDDSVFSGPSVAGPQIPPEFLKAQHVEDEDEDEDDYAPSLPPDLAASRNAAPVVYAPAKPVKGPSLPSSYYPNDDSDDDVGPRPLPPSAQGSQSEVDGVKQFLEKEERRRQQIEVGLISHLLHVQKPTVYRKLPSQKLPSATNGCSGLRRHQNC